MKIAINIECFKLAHSDTYAVIFPNGGLVLFGEKRITAAIPPQGEALLNPGAIMGRVPLGLGTTVLGFLRVNTRDGAVKLVSGVELQATICTTLTRELNRRGV